jgi:Protein of unknown function (DUF2975)
MPRSNLAILRLSRTVLKLLIALNLTFGVLIFVLLIASLAAPAQVFAALGADLGNAGLVRGMRLLVVVGILSVPLAHVVLTRLLAIVATVGRGDPFVTENATRLQRIAWALLGLELLHLAAGAIAAASSSPAAPLDIDWSFSVTGWLAVLLLFVLARVFDQGARMRDDLEGTV